MSKIIYPKSKYPVHIHRGKWSLQGKAAKGEHGKMFAFRVKMGDYEVELGGTRDEVLKTIEELPTLMASVHKGFEVVKPKTVATITVKTAASKEKDALRERFPSIPQADSVDEGVLRVLETDWGKWRPRTIDELRDALKANGVDCAVKALSAILGTFEREGKVRKWKTDCGFVYILAEEEALGLKGDA
jgi:hypothetical protein